MTKTIFYFFLFIIVTSCGTKSTERMISEGEYDSAINKAAQKLRKSKTNKSSNDYILFLAEAYTKANDRDNRDIKLLVQEANPQKLEQIFTIYKSLNIRQEKIRPLLPLKVNNQEVPFVFEDYTEEIISSQKALAEYLYNNSKALLSTKNKINGRRAYEDLIYLTEISTNYKDVNSLIKEAQFLGTDFIHVYTNNETNILIPIALNNALLDFSTYGLDEKWTEYHSNKQKNINYDYAIGINFRRINISPEQINRSEFKVEKQIIDGKIKKLDSRGRVVRDSLGRDVVIDNVKVIGAVINEVCQFKMVQVVAKIDYINLNRNQTIQSFPIASEYIFENIYATFKGDQRAVDPSYLPNFRNGPIPFPNNQRMVFDAGEDLKNKVKSIIKNNRLNR